MYVLGIETSCDETAAAIVENGRRILSNEVSSSLRLHKRFGGVVPEIAARKHIEYINIVVDKALKGAGIKLNRLKLVAVTSGPGLINALLVGKSFAQGLSESLGLPLVEVDHLRAHIYGCLMQKRAPKFPFIGLVISGGHTSIFYVKDFNNFKILGQTIDDAIGEAFDKVAKVLGLGYPGGPIIEKRARQGNPKAIRFLQPYLKENNLDFSFSGIKTAVLYYAKGKARSGKLINDISASFQEAVFDGVISRVISACKRTGIYRVATGGGVSINSRLREKFNGAIPMPYLQVYFPPAELCLDNAAIVAGLGYQIFSARGKKRR